MIHRNLTYGVFLFIGVLSLLSFTALHDPLLHGFMAIVNGWTVVGWEKGIFTGFTIAEVTEEQYLNTPLINVWLYYMFPPLDLFFIPPIIYFLNPDRIIALFATVLMFLNFASLSPERLLEGSDSTQGMNLLMERGVEPIVALSIHWGIFILAIVTFFSVLWVAFENNKEDSEDRIDEIKGKLVG